MEGAGVEPADGLGGAPAFALLDREQARLTNLAERVHGTTVGACRREKPSAGHPARSEHVDPEYRVDMAPKQKTPARSAATSRA